MNFCILYNFCPVLSIIPKIISSLHLSFFNLGGFFALYTSLRMLKHCCFNLDKYANSLGVELKNSGIDIKIRTEIGISILNTS